MAASVLNTMHDHVSLTVVPHVVEARATLYPVSGWRSFCLTFEKQTFQANTCREEQCGRHEPRIALPHIQCMQSLLIFTYC